jgi:hypothetical protein
MGLLNDLRDSAGRINPAILMTEDKDSAIRHFRDSQQESTMKVHSTILAKRGSVDTQSGQAWVNS